MVDHLIARLSVFWGSAEPFAVFLRDYAWPAIFIVIKIVGILIPLLVGVAY